MNSKIDPFYYSSQVNRILLMCFLEGIYSPWGVSRARTIPSTGNQSNFNFRRESEVLV